jgi:hypothetical protein
MSSSPERPSQVDAAPNSSGRLSAASGLAAAALLIVSFAVVGTGVPTYDDSPRAFASFYAANSSSIELSVLLGIFAAGAFLWFLGCLRCVFGEAEQLARGFTRATPIAFAAGIAGVAVSLTYDTAREAAVVAQGTVDPGVVRTFDLFGAYSLTAAALLFSVFTAAAFFLTRATQVLPAWLGYVALISTPLGVMQSFLLLAPQNDNGMFGVLGYAWFASFLVWLLGAAATLARRAS